MAIATETTGGPIPPADTPFHIEQHGIDHIPLDERWATPRDIGGMWAGASVQIEYFMYGAILMTFGFTFAQALSLIVIGNLSYLLLGICSLQGPQAGTTVFAVNRAGYGPNGSRLIAPSTSLRPSVSTWSCSVPPMPSNSTPLHEHRCSE